MINLLPTKVKNDIKFARLNVTIVEYSVLALAMALGLVGILFFGHTLASREEVLLTNLVNDKRANLADYDQDLEKAKTLDKRIDTIEALLEREIAFSRLLPSIGALVPPGTNINGLELDTEDGNNLKINGQSSTQNGASVFRENLVNSGDIFTRADIVSINLVPSDSGPEVYAFQIDAQFAPGAKQELGQ